MPEIIDDPAIVMLWGITRESLEAQLEFADQATRDDIASRTADCQRVSREEPGCRAYCFAPDPGHDMPDLWTLPNGSLISRSCGVPSSLMVSVPRLMVKVSFSPARMLT